VVSSRIAPGTVFRSDTVAPYDHTSVLATLRDRLGIPPSSMLPSRRIAAAPTLAQLLTLPTPRSDVPQLPPPPPSTAATPATAAPNDLQRSLVSGTARRYGLDPAQELAQVHTRQHAVQFFKRTRAHRVR
jgi:phospholipase C